MTQQKTATNTRAREPQVVRLKGDTTNPAKAIAAHAMRGPLGNAITAANFSQASGAYVDDFKLDISECVEFLEEQAKAVGRNDFSDAEAMLASQAAALNAVFGELARRALVNMNGGYLEAGDRYMRIAMKAQSNCRMTWETLAAIKNPPIFTRQANIAQNQQVNNAPVSNGPRASENASPQNELGALEHDHADPLDFGTTSALRRDDAAAQTVGEVHRPEDSGGKGQVSQERRQGQGAKGRRAARTDAGTQGAAVGAGSLGVTR